MAEKKYNIKLDLSKMKNVFIKEIQGSSRTLQCVCIPIRDNNIFVSERKSIYLDMQATPLQSERYGQSHLIKPKVGSENWKAMSEEERKAIPIIGNLAPITYGDEGGQEYQQPAPQDRPRTADEVYGNRPQQGYVNNSFNDNDIPL